MHAHSVRRVSPHVLKAPLHDIIILENGFCMGKSLGLLRFAQSGTRRYKHSGSKRHYAHMNEGHTYKSHLLV